MIAAIPSDDHYSNTELSTTHLLLVIVMHVYHTGILLPSRQGSISYNETRKLVEKTSSTLHHNLSYMYLIDE